MRTDLDLSEIPALDEVIKLEADSTTCYQILNLFAILSEQKTYFIRHNLNEFFAESYINMVDNTRQAHFNSKGKTTKSITDSRQADYFPKIKGINLLKHGTRKLEYFKEHSFPVIDRVLNFVGKLLAYCKIENPVFFELLNDQLTLLREILDSSTSRVLLPEFIEKAMEQLICIKFIWS